MLSEMEHKETAYLQDITCRRIRKMIRNFIGDHLLPETALMFSGQSTGLIFHSFHCYFSAQSGQDYLSRAYWSSTSCHSISLKHLRRSQTVIKTAAIHVDPLPNFPYIDISLDCVDREHISNHLEHIQY